jgi:hypothetical protein
VLLYMLGTTLISRESYLSFVQMEWESFSCAGTIASSCDHIADHRGSLKSQKQQTNHLTEQPRSGGKRQPRECRDEGARGVSMGRLILFHAFLNCYEMLRSKPPRTYRMDFTEAPEDPERRNKVTLEGTKEPAVAGNLRAMSNHHVSCTWNKATN